MGALLSILTGWVAFGQNPTWDTTGNNLLNGTYYFREVAWVADSTNGGALTEALALYGTITFNGSAPGTYTINAQELDGGAGTLSPVTLSGTYSMGAGGFGFLSHPLQSGSVIRGMVSNGIFVGSCTEAGSFNDLFVAGQIPSPAPTLSTFSGSYAMSYMNYDSTNVQYFEDAQFALNPNGAGSLGNVSMRGYFAGNGTTITGQVASNVRYIASGGAVVITFPAAPQNGALTLVNGQEYLYFSPDGNFVFGGSPNDFDFLIGVRTTSGGSPQLLADKSVYYNAGVYSDATQIGSTGALDLNTYYGSFSLSGGTLIQHSRLFSALNGTYSAITTGTAPTTAGATYGDPYDNYTIGNGGNVRIGFGIPPYLGIDIALLAPAPNVSGSVVLNPLGVVNAGSYAPFTTGLSPGELIVLTGTGLSSGPLQIASTATFPNKLNNVQVLIDGIAAPLYYVSPTQIAALVPYATSTFGIATVQVKNNGVASNIVTEFINSTTPGVLTSPANGISDAAALHSDYSLVTESNPAKQGETVSIYLTGLGAVFPPISDGAPGSSDPSSLNNTTNTIAALVGGQSATVLYAGLAPGYAGLYQMNITIPTGLTAGDNLLDIEGPDSYASEALIPVGSATSGGVASPAGTEVQNGQAQKPSKHGKPRPSQKHVVVNPVQP